MTKKSTPKKDAVELAPTDVVTEVDLDAALADMVDDTVKDVVVDEIVKGTYAPLHAVRAEITLNDGTVKVFSGEAQDSELDLSKIEVNG